MKNHSCINALRGRRRTRPVLSIPPARPWALLLLFLLALLGTAGRVDAQGRLRVTCPPDQTNWTCGASFSAVTYPLPVGVAACAGAAGVACTPPPGSAFAVGLTTVTCLVTNVCGETAACSFRVSVMRDLVPPQVSCPTGLVVVICGIPGPVPVNYPLPPAVDNTGGGVMVSCVPPPGSLFPQGVTAVQCTAVDACTNRAACTFTITVRRDATGPELRCPPDRVARACDAAGTLVVYPAPAAVDNLDPAPRVTCDPPSGSLFPAGLTVVRCAATDACSNRTECAFQVTVEVDAAPPHIVCPPDRIVHTCLTNGLVVNYAAPVVADDLDPAPWVVCVPPAGSAFPPGITVVHCTATDFCGKQGSCSFEVRVLVDQFPPVLECPPDVVIATCATAGVLVDYPAPTADDDGFGPVVVNCIPPAHGFFPMGTTVVNCVAVDACGKASQCSFLVTVRRDDVPPVIECPPDIVVDTCDPRGTVVTWPEPVATDQQVPAPEVVCVPVSGSVFPVGTTRVTCEAVDACGNRSQCGFDVTVRPDESIAGTDRNRDGRSDVWEIRFRAAGLAPGEDTDGDGASNAAEAAMGTDPRDPRSVLKVVPHGVATPASDYLLVIDGVAGETATRSVQVQFTPGLTQPWRNLGAPVRLGPGERMLRIPREAAGAGTNPAAAFFRVAILPVDDDGDGLSAWEEVVVGTSDRTPDTWGRPGGDAGEAGRWLAEHAGAGSLTEVALAHLGGSPLGPTAAKLVTAAGTGGWFQLTSWTLDPGSLAPVPLADTVPIEGWNAKLEALVPAGSPGLGLNPFINGRIQSDTLWLTTRRVDDAGAHSAMSTVGYGPNASLQIFDFALAHESVAGSGVASERFLVVTPVMGSNTVGRRELRLITWLVNPFTGGLTGLQDSGDLGHTNLPADGGRLQVLRERDGRYVVSYLNGSAQLSSWFFDVSPAGMASPRGGAVSGLDLRGGALSPLASTDFVLGPLLPTGFVTLLGDTGCSARLAVWEDRVVDCDAACYARPFLITDSTLDLNPAAPGLVIAAPVLRDAWDDTAFSLDRFGEAVATGDFNGDGIDDAAVGIPGHDVAKDGVASAESAGRVSIRYGTAGGPTGAYPDRAWSQDSDGILGVADADDRMGAALAAGDFNGDGYADLAVGVPGEDVDGLVNAGAVQVLYGSASGLRAAGNQLWYQGQGGLAGQPGTDDWFGHALVAGDFNGDGFADLAVGVPRETIAGVPDAGAVQILHGAAGGLSAAAGAGAQFLHRGLPGMPVGLVPATFFGLVLAAGDLNGDGRDDLVTGLPHEDGGGAVDSGAVQITFGSATGLAGVHQYITQGAIQPGGGAFAAAPEAGDAFGYRVAVGDFDADGFADLAVGVPLEDREDLGIPDAGVVHVLPGGPAGVTDAGHQLLTDAIPEVADALGSALVVGDFNGDGRADLAVGSPNEDVINNTVIDAGYVTIYHGGAGALVWGGGIQQGALSGGGYAETAEHGDRFGVALAAGDLNGDGYVDLLAGIPSEDLVRGDDENRPDPGAVQLIFGGPGGLSGTNDVVWAQGEPFRIRALLTDQGREAVGGIGAGRLYEQMPDGERTNVHVASVTKCMTLLLAAELILTPGANVALDDDVTVSALAAGTAGSVVEPPYGPLLAEGDHLPLELLLNAMMMRSCNKSSVAIAEHLARRQYQLRHGAVPAGFDACGYFVTNMMQGKAGELQMVNTVCGHPAGGMITTPQDLVTLWRHAWQFPVFRQVASATAYDGEGVDALGNPTLYSLVKHSAAGGYPGLEGWKGGNGGIWHGAAPFGIPLVNESVLGQATRLGHSLTFALQQTGDRWLDGPDLLDYGFRRLFTPDLRGGGEIVVPGMTDFTVRRVTDTLAVTAVVSAAGELRLDSWQTVAGLGQATSLQHAARDLAALASGNQPARSKRLDLSRVPSVDESEADYVTGHREGPVLRLNVWRVGALPGF